MDWLKGRKTYVVSGLIVASSLVQLVVGDISLIEFLSSEQLLILLGGLGLGSLRAGVKKSE